MTLHSIFCNHYQAMSEHKSCKAGVCYEQFKGTPHENIPCWVRNDGRQPPGGCEHAAYPTAEELAEDDRMRQAMFANMVLARSAIVEHLGGRWKKGMPSETGEIECPVCKVGKLRFSRYNGHIHAACTTDKCVQWME